MNAPPAPTRHLARLVFVAFLLTFIASRTLLILIDEFGMWLHLGGSYWQHASFDAVVVLLSIFGLVAFMPRWQHLQLTISRPPRFC